MQSFYRYLKNGSSKSEALTNAKLDYYKNYKGTKLKEPYYWAGFVLIGNADPIFRNRDNGVLSGLIFLGLILLVFSTKFIYCKQ